MEKKQKRFYKENEIIWVIGKQKEGKILSIDKENLKVIVEVEGEKLELKLWDIDKIKYLAKEKLISEKRKTKATNNRLPVVYFAKVKESAIIPSKRDEDAGYDIYANIEGVEAEGKTVYELRCPKGKTTLVPTGIAMALPKTHYFNTKHERGSTGKIGLSVLAGVIDSGYRGEIFIAVNPLHKDVLITSEVADTEDLGETILYPYSKAICQGTIDLVPKVEIKEISYEELQTIESERGTTKLGQSGK